MQNLVSSPASDGVPSLVVQEAAATPVKPWMKKKIVEKSPSPTLEESRKREEDDRPPNVPPPDRPSAKKVAGRPWENKETGAPISRSLPKLPARQGREETQEQASPPVETGLGARNWKKELPKQPPKVQKDPLATNTMSQTTRKRSSASEPVQKEDANQVQNSLKNGSKQFAYK